MTLGKTIRNLRLGEALDQRDMALKVGVSQSQISRIEHDERRPSVTLLERIVLVLGKTPNDLLDKELRQLDEVRRTTGWPSMQHPWSGGSRSI
jgi:transcriptional regulator with XRE-family HTH domain